MTRVQSQRTRQALLVVGTAMEETPPPERLELFLPDGTPVDVGKDRTRARWRGTWVTSPEEPYETNDFVLDEEKLYILTDADLLGPDDKPSSSETGAWVLMTVSGGLSWEGVYNESLAYSADSMVSHEGGVWYAPVDLTPGIIPGVEVEDDDIEVNRGVMFKASDRLASVSPVEFVIGDPPGKRRDNDISGGFSAAIFIDRIGSIAGTELTITPIDAASTAGLSINAFSSGGGYDAGMTLTWSSAEVDSQTPKTIALSDADRFIHVFFDGGIDGSFTAFVSNSTNLVAPPDVEKAWDLIIAAPPDDKMRWMGVWVDDVDYVANDVVNHNDGIWVATGDLGIDVEPAVGGIPTRTSHAYAFGNFNLDDTPIIFKDEPFTDLASAPVADAWIGGGSKMVSFDAEPGSSVTITTVGGAMVPYRDTGASGSGNSEIGSSHSYASPLTITVPSEGRISLELAPAVTSVVVTGDGVDEAPAVWELMLESATGGGGGGGTVEDWHVVGDSGEPAFLHSWGAGSPAVTKFRKNGNVVELRGFAVKGSPVGRSVIFTLPVGYRIESAEDVMRFPVSGAASGYVTVSTNGDVECDEMAYVSLDPVRFSVE